MPVRPQSPILARLRLIGQMEAWTLTSESVLPPGRKTRALLAIVALGAPRPVLRSRLAEMLWSRRAEEQARASLRQEIHRLLEALGPRRRRNHQRQPRPAASSCPAPSGWMSRRCCARPRRARPRCRCSTATCWRIWTGSIRPSTPGCTAERERLRDRARNVAEALLREQVEPETAIPAAQQLLSIDRAHEGAWRALMRAHAARGERGMAIQAYERCRAVLADLLDAAPSPETQKLLARSATPGEMPAAPRRGRRGRPRPSERTAMAGRAAARARRRDAARARRATDEEMPISRRGSPRRSPRRWPGSAGCSWCRAPRSPAWRCRPATRPRSAAPSASTSCWTARCSASARALRITRPAARPARRQPGGLGAPVRPAAQRPAHAAGRDRRRGGRADRPRDPADRGEARRAAGRRTDPTAYDLDAARAVPDRPASTASSSRRRAVCSRARSQLEPDYAAAHALVRLLAHLPGRPGLGGGRSRRRSKRPGAAPSAPSRSIRRTPRR